MRRTATIIGITAILLLGAVHPAGATTTSTVPVSMTFIEPSGPQFVKGDCPLFPDDGVCGTGAVVPFGQATEMIAFTADCCGLRTINLPQGSIFTDETLVTFECRGSCQPNPVIRGTSTGTDVIRGGTGLFQGASGVLDITLQLGLGVYQPIGETMVKISGTMVLPS